MINCQYQKETSHKSEEKKMPMRLKQESYASLKVMGLKHSVSFMTEMIDFS